MNLDTRWTLLAATCSDLASAMRRRLRSSNAKPVEKAVHEWENEGGNVAPTPDASITSRQQLTRSADPP